MHLLMPWVLPVAALVGGWGTSLARGLGHPGDQPAAPRGDRATLLLVAWTPLAVWLLVQLAHVRRLP